MTRTFPQNPQINKTAAPQRAFNEFLKIEYKSGMERLYMYTVRRSRNDAVHPHFEITTAVGLNLLFVRYLQKIQK